MGSENADGGRSLRFLAGGFFSQIIRSGDKNVPAPYRLAPDAGNYMEIACPQGSPRNGTLQAGFPNSSLPAICASLRFQGAGGWFAEAKIMGFSKNQP